MKAATPITDELRTRFREMLVIDASSPSGLRWKVAKGKMKPGDPAGSLRVDGYWQVNFDYRLYQNHRVVWALTHDLNPGPLEIDHVNGVCSDNRSENLRLATHGENQMNKCNLQSNNRSGVRGVSWSKGMGKWRARIKSNRQEVVLGYFDSIEEAATVRYAAEPRYFGNFAPIK